MAFQSLYSKLNRRASSAILPNDNLSPYYAPANIPRRFMRTAAGAVMIISLFLVWYTYGSGRRTELMSPSADRPPPLYQHYSESEEQLPQHDLTLPFPEGRHAKYIWFSNHVRSTWWQYLIFRCLRWQSRRRWVGKSYAGTRHECSPGLRHKEGVSDDINWNHFTWN